MMEIVIKIPEWKYKSICEGVEASERCGVVGIDFNIHEAIRNCTPLPKGHGGLIDEKEVYKKLYCRCLAGVAKEILDEISPIIEADKGSEDDGISD